MVLTDREKQFYDRFQKRRDDVMRSGEDTFGDGKLIYKLSCLIMWDWGHNLPSQISQKRFQEERDKLDAIVAQMVSDDCSERLREALRDARDCLNMIELYRVRNRKCLVM